MADVWVRCTEELLLSTASIGDLIDVTISGMGTPKAVMCFMTTAATNGTIYDGNATFMVGWAVHRGTNAAEEGAAWASINSSKDDLRGHLRTACIQWSGTNIQLTGEGDGSAGNPGAITDGWRFEYVQNSTGVNRMLKVVFFGGADLSVNTYHHELGNTAGAQTWTLDANTGDGQFTPELIFSTTIGSSVTTTGGQHAIFSFGVTDLRTGSETNLAHQLFFDDQLSLSQILLHYYEFHFLQVSTHYLDFLL